MAEKYVQTIGRRKNATAQIRLFNGGTGKVTINDKDISEYFGGVVSFKENALSPLKEVGRLEAVDITVRAVGGGLRGQSDAIKLGIARALITDDESLKFTVKAKGFLTRDPRKKERKKFGLRGARRAKQWRKR